LLCLVVGRIIDLLTGNVSGRSRASFAAHDSSALPSNAGE